MPKAAQDTHLIISVAVKEWYRYYNLGWDDQASSFLCDAAIDLYNQGCRSSEEMATILIGTYVGLESTRVNAPSSTSLH